MLRTQWKLLSRLSFLEDAFRMSLHHAYEVWRWMNQKGYYPVYFAKQ
ncbi:spore coat protein [Orenia marismortui]|nr:spore coat protein [Orenia marismortui]